MFSRPHRLSRPAFGHVFKKGRRVHLPHLTLVYEPGPQRRAGVVVGKKVARRAVARNRLRRQLYAALRTLGLPRGHTIVLAKPTAAVCGYEELHHELSTGIARMVGFAAQSR